MPFASEFGFPFLDFQTPAGFTNNVRIFEYRTGSVFEFWKYGLKLPQTQSFLSRKRVSDRSLGPFHSSCFHLGFMVPTLSRLCPCELAPWPDAAKQRRFALCVKALMTSNLNTTFHFMVTWQTESFLSHKRVGDRSLGPFHPSCFQLGFMVPTLSRLLPSLPHMGT